MRKIHKKSRLGCLTCKRRKVKCDETTPECGNCVKFGVPCDYSSLNLHTSRSSSPTAAKPSHRGRGRPRSDWASWAEQIRISSSARASGSSAAGSCCCDVPRLNVDDLELFYNYLTNTARTLGDGSDCALWQEGVAQLGFQYPCVLDLMLSLSALHLSRQRPEQAARYEVLAERHSTAALHAATALMRDMVKENCPALYISAALICFTSFAKGPSRRDMLLVADDGQVPWLSLIKGVKLVVSGMGWSCVFSGILEKYHPHLSEPQRKGDTDESKTPSTLTAIEDWRSSLEMISDLIVVLPDRECREVYSREVEALTRYVEATFGSGTDARVGTIGKMEVVMGWVYGVKDEFVERLGQKHPAALIILGHFCVLLRTLESYWFMQGWAQHVMKEVIDATDEACHKWLAWPIKFLGDVGFLQSSPTSSQDGV